MEGRLIIRRELCIVVCVVLRKPSFRVEPSRLFEVSLRVRGCEGGRQYRGLLLSYGIE
jgi:hypothetical protein